uniref:Uncharacterized protein n=1 Tax=Rhizophora mucronata TaxID=61149 RepID=A0A2P2Q6F3_RHIMU
MRDILGKLLALKNNYGIRCSKLPDHSNAL